MQIRVNDDWRIVSNPYEWRVEKRATHTKRDTGEKYDHWSTESYHPRLDSALACLGDKMLRASEASTYPDILAEMKRVTDTLRSVLASLTAL